MNKKASLTFLSLAAAVCAMTTSAANATVTDWGTHDTVEYGAGTPGVGSFMDVFSFMLPPSDELASTTVANNLYITGDTRLHISDGMVQLYSGIFGDATPDTLKLSYSFDGTTGNTSHSLGGLETGPFYYEVSGLADGSHGGYYTLTSTFTAAPVPEPETYGMLTAGLGLLGFVARKRSKGG